MLTANTVIDQTTVLYDFDASSEVEVDVSCVTLYMSHLTEGDTGIRGRDRQCAGKTGPRGQPGVVVSGETVGEPLVNVSIKACRDTSRTAGICTSQLLESLKRVCIELYIFNHNMPSLTDALGIRLSSDQLAWLLAAKVHRFMFLAQSMSSSSSSSLPVANKALNI